MITIAPRSSMMARAVRKSLSELGTRRPSSASTPSENAISVADGIAQPEAAPGIVPGGGEIDQRRHDHPAERGAGRQQRLPRLGELAVEQLALDLEPDQQKEDRHQPVVDPQQQRLLDREFADPHRGADAQQHIVGSGQGGVGEHQSERRGQHQHDGACRLVPEQPLQCAEPHRAFSNSSPGVPAPG